MSKFIPILKVGRYTDASGRKYDITPQVLKEIQETYQSKSAPLVKGHPTNDAPAMGWIEKLKIQGEELLASFSEIPEAFKKEVESGAFRNVSASFFMPLSDSNPSKGKYSLRHVGALGASRPAIPNLGTLQDAIASFCVSTEEDITCYVEFAELGESLNFFEKLIKSAIEKALKKQREEIMVEVKKVISSMSFSEGHLSYSTNENKHTNDSEVNDMSDKKTARELELEQELQKQKDEINRLKTEQDKAERSKVIADEVRKVVEEKNLDEETAQKLTEKAEASPVEDGKKAVADFSEFIPNQKKVTNHRFGDRSADLGRGSADFSEDDKPIENTVLFADEVAKLETQGVPRAEAFRQAKESLKSK